MANKHWITCSHRASMRIARLSPRYWVLLDLNLPEVNGFKVLERVKTDQSTRHIPVIVITTTDSKEEINRCYQLGCNAYITKPVDYGAFSKTICNLGLFIQILSPARI